MFKTIKTSINDTKQALDGIKQSINGVKEEADVLKGNLALVQAQVKEKPAKLKSSMSYLKLGIADAKATIAETKQGVTEVKDAGKDKETAGKLVPGAEFVREEGGFTLKKGSEVIGEITYAVGPEEDTWMANHTYVKPEYRGGSIAKALLDRLVEEARKEDKKIFPVCSYVVAQFRRDSDYKDVWHQY
ncbi:GNAT family N-acetyltransferase [Saccharibacillus sp. CPCC 101409]|uniref:GNAT family N-acetyltransferase n=1 Tax=Saccharibacillus sp. CPCC 101409 TaxID=3058041 RepID=UPI002673908B|nr:GNAT family N-acetyltransferase [Saccharibacillus sp. CPCC 101409]MDO3412290.1 GNAT family N-acetyltransferase [Saccharibacillus sp. CPCC 101409]